MKKGRKEGKSTLGYLWFMCDVLSRVLIWRRFEGQQLAALSMAAPKMLGFPSSTRQENHRTMIWHGRKIPGIIPVSFAFSLLMALQF